MGRTRRRVVNSKRHRRHLGYNEFEYQVVAIMDAIEVLHPTHQMVLEVDHSQGHAKGRENGLYAKKMNLSTGGKQDIPRDSRITKGCLEPAGFYKARGVYPGRVYEGDTQHFAFGPGDVLGPYESQKRDGRRPPDGTAKGIAQILWERYVSLPPSPHVQPRISAATASYHARDPAFES